MSNFMRREALIFGLFGALSSHTSAFAQNNRGDAKTSLKRQILSRFVPHLDSGKENFGGDASIAIHRNFAQVIEQNFAAADESNVRRTLQSLNELELKDLAQLYVNASADSGRDQQLLDILAFNLTGKELGRLSKHFGFGPTYAALQRRSPRLTEDFLTFSDPNWRQPTPGVYIHHASGERAAHRQYAGYRPPAINAGMVKTQSGIGRFLNSTPLEIYLDFRTSPVGSLGVAGALWETTFVLSGAVTLAWYGGTWVGTQINDIINIYFPAFGDAIGGTIYNMIESLHNATSGSTHEGQLQQSIADGMLGEMDLPADVRNNAMTQYNLTQFGGGGDYGVAYSWYRNATSNNCNCTHNIPT